VQWRVEDGGNGHWYAGVALSGGTVWTEARGIAAAHGGYLATVTSIEEFGWIVGVPASASSLWNGTRGPFLGGEQASGSVGATVGWSWITGEPWYEVWGAANCGADNFNDADALTLGRCNPKAAVSFNDWPRNSNPFSVYGYIIEWSADCNGDGIVDFGQIRAGTLADINHNNIPDCCEAGSCLPCQADVDQSGAINGVDLAAVLNNWGTSGGKQPRSDVNGDGMVDGADLAEVLNGWGPCN